MASAHMSRVSLVVVSLLFSSIKQGLGTEWLETPNSTKDGFVGDDLKLTYRYYSAVRGTQVRLTFAYHVPGTSHENILVDGSVNMQSGDIVISSQRYPGKVNLTSHRGGFEVIITSLEIRDIGNYLIDVFIDHYNTLHHSLMVQVFNRPQFTPGEIPPSEIIRDENGTVDMLWMLESVPNLPAVEGVLINHTMNGVAYTVVDQRMTSETGQWLIKYPAERLRFKGRISYATGPNLEHIKMVISKLRKDDCGLFHLAITYVKELAVLGSSVQLYVVGDHKWRFTPSEIVYLVESGERVISYTTERQQGDDIITYELSKDTGGRPETTLASLTITPTNTLQDLTQAWNPQWALGIDDTSVGLVIRLKGTTTGDSGTYSMKLRDASGFVILHHRFSLVLLQESTLRPKVNKLPQNPEGAIDVTVVPGDHPPPDILVYMGLDNETRPRAVANKSFAMTTILPPGQEHVTVMVIYDFDGWLWNSSLFMELNPQTVVPSTSPATTSMDDSPRTCTDAEEKSEDNKQILLVTNLVFTIVTLVLLSSSILAHHKRLRNHDPRLSS